MGKIKYLGKVMALFEKSPVVEFSSLARIAGKGYAKLLVNNFLKNKKIFRLTKGHYTKHNEINLAVLCFKPAYLGLQSALSFHKLWEQETVPIILTATKTRSGIRKIERNNVYNRNHRTNAADFSPLTKCGLISEQTTAANASGFSPTVVYIRRINKKYMFGFSYLNDGDFYLPHSDIEKTLIDMIYFKEKISKETLNEIKKRINKKKLKEYLKKYPKRIRKEVLET